VGPDNCLVGAAQLLALMDFPLESLDEDLECCFQRVILFWSWPLQDLVLSKKRCKKRAAESAQTARNAELEMLAKS
jgi:hypothetical protein